jgi:4-amino-4-deoxy-L-arabinose transferase-like glycosyltransferase
MHQVALTGGDRYVNLLQWGAFLLTLIGVSAVAGELGAKRDTQIAAALLSAGIPMAVLQATTARNDLVVAAWLVSLVWFGLRWGRQPDSWLWAAGTGLSLGLSLLTKATGFLYGLPLGLLIGTLVIKDGGLRRGLARGVFVLLLALALNLGHLSRNWSLYGDPVGTHERVGNDVMSPAVFVSNSIRNVAMHVPTDCKRPLAFLNPPGRLVLAGLERLHSLTGLSPTDSRTTWGYVDIFTRSFGCIQDEHYAGNALHALLLLVTVLALPFFRSVGRRTKWFALALVLGFVLLSLILRWQVWGSHLQLPLFVLWAPIVAITLGSVPRIHLARIAGLLAVVLSFLWIYNNRPRPLSGLISGSIPTRDEQYFYYTKAVYPDYAAMTDLIARTECDRLGLNISSLALEYPFWILLREKGFEGVIQHVDVINETSVLEDAAFVPCAIISEGFIYDYAAIRAEQKFGSFYVYLDETGVTPSAAN